MASRTTSLFLEKAAGGSLVFLSPKTSAAPRLQLQQPIIPAVHNSGVFGCFGSKLDLILPVVDAPDRSQHESRGASEKPIYPPQHPTMNLPS
jgi:hypothetical protein